MVKDGTMYKDHGCNQFDRRLTDKQKQRLVKRLTEPGHPVGIEARLPPDPCLWHCRS